MADERYITQARGRRRQAAADRHARPAEPAARHRAVLRRGSAQAPRAAVRREGALRKRPLGADDARHRRCRSIANKALEHGLRALRQAPRLAASRRATCSPSSHTIDGYKDERWTRPIAVGDVVPAVVVTAPKTGAARLRIGRYHADLETRRLHVDAARRPPRISFKPGDLIDVAITKVDAATGDGDGDARAGAAGRRRDAGHRQPHRPDQGDGRRLELQRAASSTARCRRYRQLGSTFKPIVYTAAIDRGFTPTSIIVDAPVSYPAGNGQIYSPHNYDHKFLGPITLRYALEESRNIPAIKMMDTLGPKNVLDVRQALRLRGGLSALPADRARRRRRDAARDHERLHDVPESGRADEAVLGAER